MRAALQLPAHAFPGKFERVGKLTLRPGQERPNGEVTRAGENLGRYVTDPDAVLLPDGRFRIAFNHSTWDEQIRRYPTQVWTTVQDADSLLCEIPQPWLTPIYTPGQVQPIQFETPSLGEGPREPTLAVMEYQLTPTSSGARGAPRSRVSVVSFWSGDWGGPLQRVGVPITPSTRYEAPFRPPGEAYEAGGCSEPSMVTAGEWLLVFFQMYTYADGNSVRPSIGVAGSRDGGRSWVKLPEPILTEHDADGGAGQPHAVLDPRGGVHLFWQTRRRDPADPERPVYEFHHGFIYGLLNDVLRNPNNPILTTRGETGWDRGRLTALGVEIEMRGSRAVFHGHYFGGAGGAGSGETNWIGYCRFEER